MKRRFLLFLLILSTHFSSGQTIPIDSFYTPGATWTSYTVQSEMYLQNYYSHIYRVEKDSMISGTNYHLISEKYNGGFSDFESTMYDSIVTTYFPDTGGYRIIFGVRDSGKKVYFLNLDATYAFGTWPYNTEQLMYDYNIKAGDTLSWKPYNNVVLRVDSVQLSNKAFVHRYYFDTSFVNDFWLEAIGSNLGITGSLDYDIYELLGDYSDDYLLCYSQSGFSYHFPDTDNAFSLGENLYDNCFNLPELNLPNSNAQSFTIFPNPLIGNMLYFEDGNLSDITFINVYDHTGRLVCSFQYPFLNGNNQLLLAIQPGVYFLRAKFTDNTIVTKTFTKIR